MNASQASDRDAILAMVQSQAEAWNRADAEAFAERYAEDGTFTNIVGMQVEGKAGFVTQHAHIFRTIYVGSQITLNANGIRFLRPDVAVVNIDATLVNTKHLPPGVKLGSDGALRTKLLEVLTKEDDGWWIAAFHNVAVIPTSPS